MSKFAWMGLSVAACVVAASAPAQSQEVAQDAAQTAGGNVTADEATPLPPVVVEAPRERRRPARRQAATPVVAPSTTAAAQSSSEIVQPVTSGGEGAGSDGDFPTGPVGVFTLGQLDLVGGSTITNEAMWTYNKQSLASAVNILPGVSTSASGNSRNERDIYVRGFDRFRVPLYQDGVRVYLPYDNRLDFNRFLTDDIAEIQVQKGYVSVLNGPGGMGGAINMVSRKPTKAIELEGRSGAVFNGDMDDLNQWSSYAFAGTRQNMWYAQLSGNIVDRDAFNLSQDFTPATSSVAGFQSDFPYEDGGDRDRSDFRDWRVNTKIGLTPNTTDEYVVNYTNQQGQKSAPLHTERQAVQGYFLGNNRRFWDWPEWDTSSLSWLSKTQLGSSSYVKTNAYYNTFDNTTRFFADPTAPNEDQNYELYSRIMLDSVYRDTSRGGFVEMGTELIPMNTLKGAIHYRRDVHHEYDINFDTNTGNFNYQSGIEVQSEETWSFALENTLHAARNLDVVLGASYDLNSVIRADGSTGPLPTPDADAWNGQGALIYRYSDEGKTFASISSRTRFPTLFDRYSTRLGARAINPDLEPERATNYEIGWSDRPLRNVKLASSIFYSDITDGIQNVFAHANGTFATTDTPSVVGINADGEYYGAELSADWDLTSTLRVGGNYTYLERHFNYAAAALGLPASVSAQVAAAEVEGTPRHEIFLYAAWKATDKLTLTPSMEIASDRNNLITSCRSTLPFRDSMATRDQFDAGCTPPGPTASPSVSRPNYDRIGSYAIVNFQAEYAFTDNATVAVGGTNLFDEDYNLADGFPEPGRQFFANARVKF